MKRIFALLGCLLLILGCALTAGCSTPAEIDVAQAVLVGSSYFENVGKLTDVTFYRCMFVFYTQSDLRMMTPEYNLTYIREAEEGTILEMVQVNLQDSQAISMATQTVPEGELQPSPLKVEDYNCPVNEVLEIAKAETGEDWAKKAFSQKMPLAIGPDMARPGCWIINTMNARNEVSSISVDVNSKTAILATATPAPTPSETPAPDVSE